LGIGTRIVERYGASSRVGLRARAKYLVKWESLRRARDAGFQLYDVWGTHEPGVAEFKKAFGGEERFFDGAFELVTSRTGWLTHSAARRVQGLIRRVSPSASSRGR
jgi:lipid II:glycine glycyltransferase (peptidoglycan interpeptide bridge formation enzyme)